jgi:hypothetical protein
MGCDLVVLEPAHVGQEPDRLGVSFGPCFQRPRPQAACKPRHHHADAGLLDDLPHAVDMALVRFCHAPCNAAPRCEFRSAHKA